MKLDYKLLSNILLVIGVILLAFTFFMQYLPNVFNFTPINQDWWKNTIMCLGINVISSVAIVNLYDQLKEKERIRRQKLFLSNIYFPLLHHLLLLFNIYKSTAENEIKIDKMETFFNGTYYTTVSILNLCYEAPVIPERTWLTYLVQENERFSNDINRNYSKNISFLDIDLSIIVEDVLNSKWKVFVQNMQMVQDMRYMDQNQPNLYLGNFMIGPENIFKTYIDAFLKLVDYYNKYNPDKKIKIDNNWWSNNTAPLIGEALNFNNRIPTN